MGFWQTRKSLRGDLAYLRGEIDELGEKYRALKANYLMLTQKLVDMTRTADQLAAVLALERRRERARPRPSEEESSP